MKSEWRSAAELRQLAEAQAASMSTDAVVAQSPESIAAVLHELRVHQIQLEMQNEEMRKAQAELGALHDRYFDLYDLAPVGYCTINADGRIQQANLTLATMLGVGRSVLVGQQMSRLLFPGDQETFYRMRKALIATGSAQSCELRIVNLAGVPSWMHLQATVEQNFSGGFDLRVAVVDISARRQVSAARQEMEYQREQVEKAKSLGLMAGAVAHHFNNHLCAVNMAIEMVLKDLPPKEDAAEALSVALDATRAGIDLTDMMLAYIGSANPTKAPLDLSSTCAEEVQQLVVRGEMPGLTVDIKTPSLGPMVTAHADQIRQVVSQLVANAWEASGAQVRVTLQSVLPEAIPEASRFPANWQPRAAMYACLEVADSGSGIAPADINKLFDPFFSTKFVGRGLGLSMVLGIVRSSSGVVTVDSAPGQGSVFRVFLPMNDD
ncbi:MAG: ATP-binding protein [Acidobacteriota bacterium]